MPNNGYWQGNPVNLDISRSKFKMPHRWSGTLPVGKLVPICCYSDVLPGASYGLDMASVIRSLTPIVPVMDDAYLTVEAFFVPHKLTLSRKYMSPDVNDSNHSFAAIMGAQDSLLNMPLPTGGATFPAMMVNCGANADAASWKDSLACALGMPLAQESTDDDTGYFVNPFEPLAYFAVWNEYFREPNTQNPVTYTIAPGESSLSSYNLLSVNYQDGVNSGYLLDELPLLPVSRFHGYFGSALPWPQRNGSTVTVPLGDLAPVITGPTNLDLDDSEPLKWAYADTGTVPLAGTEYLTWATDNSGGNYTSSETGAGSETGYPGFVPANLYADLANSAAISINQLRFLFATQRYYESLARGGNRLEELSESLFGTRPHDAASGIPEYLGGRNIPLNMTQVNSTAGGTTSAVSQATLGSTGAFSLTNSNDKLFFKSFDTWGTIVVVACVRVKDSFCQGIARRHRRFKALDLYNPKFANIGEQPIYSEELLVHSDEIGDISLDDLSGGNAADQIDEDYGNRAIFGYQEAWAEYRYFPDIVTGDLDTVYGTVPYWTYANKFVGNKNPTLKAFLDASKQQANVDQTLQVSGSTAGFTYIAQFLFDFTVVAPMPLYSIPGLIDHH